MALLSTYVYDPTGINPLNLVVNERHSVQPPAQITDASLFFLRAAPAFAESIIVRNGPSATADVLVEGKDYILTTQFLWKSWELNKMIYGSITMINRNYSGDVYVQYQTLGGDFTVNDADYLESLSKEIYKTRYIYWEQVVQNIPGLPPFDHSMSGTDTVGWGAVVDAILRLAAAIIDTSGSGGGGSGSDAALQQHINSSTAHRLAAVGGSNLFNFAIANDADFDNAAVNRYTNPAVIVVWIRKYITSLGLGTAPQDIQQLQQRVNQIDQTIQTIQTSQTDMGSTLSGIITELTDVKDRQDVTDQSVANVAAELPAIKDDINELREKIDGDPQTGMEARLTRVETTSAGHTTHLDEVDTKLVDMQSDIDDLKAATHAPFDPADILVRLTTLESQMVTVTDDVTVLKSYHTTVVNGYDVTVPKQVLLENHQIILKPNQYANIHMVGGGLISVDPIAPDIYANHSWVQVDMVNASNTVTMLARIMNGSDAAGNAFSTTIDPVISTSLTDIVVTPSVAAIDENGSVGVPLDNGQIYGAGQTVAAGGVGGSSSPVIKFRYTNDAAVPITLRFTIKPYLPFCTLDTQPGRGAIEVAVVTP